MSDFSGISNVRIHANKNTYIQPGTHVVRVNSITTGVSNSTGKLYVAVDTEIMETTSPNEDHQPGCAVSVLMNQNLSFLPNIKMLAKALLESSTGVDLKDEDITEKAITVVLGERDPNTPRLVSKAAQGIMLRIVATEVTSKAGKNYTRVQFYTYRE